jgi:hypothetical protein
MVEMMKDEMAFDLASLMHELNFMVPDVLKCTERYLILPNKLGDLDRQECLAEIHDRIQKIKQAKELVDSCQITQAEYCTKKDEILSKMRY